MEGDINKLNNKSKLLLKLIVSISITGIFVYILTNIINLRELLLLIKEVSIRSAFAALILYIVSYILKTLRLGLTVNISDFKRLYRIISFNTLFNIFLPFRIGEFSFFYLLKKERITLAQSTMSFLTVRIFDLMSLIAMFLFTYSLYNQRLFQGILIVLFLPIIFYLLKFLVPFIKNGKITTFLKDVLTARTTFSLYTLSLLILFTKFSAFYLILPESINLQLSQSLIAASAGDLTAVLPIYGIAGLGTYEGGYAGILYLMGFEKSLALSASLLVHIFMYIGSCLIAFFCLWFT